MVSIHRTLLLVSCNFAFVSAQETRIQSACNDGDAVCEDAITTDVLLQAQKHKFKQAGLKKAFPTMKIGSKYYRATLGKG